MPVKNATRASHTQKCVNYLLLVVRKHRGSRAKPRLKLISPRCIIILYSIVERVSLILVDLGVTEDIMADFGLTCVMRGSLLVSVSHRRKNAKLNFFIRLLLLFRETNYFSVPLCTSYRCRN